MFNDTICAIATPYGVGAISVIRVSGDDAIFIVNKVFKGKSLEEAKPNTIHYGYIIDGKDIIDEVMVSVFHAPKSFTGENSCEISCHGGIYNTNRVLEVILKNGARMAEPGEYSKRAFLNGRIDLAQSEAIMDIISSSNELALKASIHSLRKGTTNLIKALREKLLDLIAKIEVNIDYPEYTDELQVTEDLMHGYLNEIKEELDSLVNGSKNGRLIKNGVNIAIIGKPNVGKSSILNSLLDEEKAIVTNIPGTTRDIVEGTITLNEVAINFIDTAGIRETEDIVEKIGVDKSKKTADASDLILLVLNNNEALSEEEQQMLDKYNSDKLIIFVNKMDLETRLVLSTNLQDVIYGNTIDINGLDKLKERIITKLNLDNIVNKDMSYLCNLREIDLINKAHEALISAQSNLDNGYSVDMIEIDLKSAWEYLGQIIGDSYDNELVDKIFSNFCLGK